MTDVVHHIAGGVLVGGASVAAVGLLLAGSIKPDIDHRTDAVDRDWKPVAAALDRRSDALGRLDTALAARGATDIAAAGTRARANWSAAAARSRAVRIEAGNGLESVSARALAIAASQPYASDAAVVRAAVDLRAAAPPADAVSALDHSIARSNAVADNPLRRLVADVAGHDDLPAFLAV